MSGTGDKDGININFLYHTVYQLHLTLPDTSVMVIIQKLGEFRVEGLGPSHPLPNGPKWSQRAKSLKRRSMIPSSLTMTQLLLCLSRVLAGKGALLSP